MYVRILPCLELWERQATASICSLVFITEGCSGRGGAVDGVVLCNKLVYNIISITTPYFHCTPLC